jgi:hypothetical protein
MNEFYEQHQASRLLQPRFRFKKALSISTIGLILSISPFATFSKGEISVINTYLEDATPTEYEKNGTTYRWGQGKNLKAESFDYNGKTLAYKTNVSRVTLRRVDNDNSSGTPCGLFAQTTGAPFTYQASYPYDGSNTGNCDIGSVMGGATLNLGALDVFANAGTVRPHSFSNIERVDFIFDHGILTPFTTSLLAEAGHTVIEKRGNNPVNVAAITQIDASGTPTGFGPLVFVHPDSAYARSAEVAEPQEIEYGITNITTSNDFLTNERHGPQGYVEYKEGDTETLGMSFISVEDLGLVAGQRYFGFAFFGADVGSEHTLTDPSTFPQDTATDTDALGSGDADLFGATAGFIELGGISGALYNDANGNGIQDESEPGIPGITITLVGDSNGNGVFDADVDQPLGDSAETDETGAYFFPGVPEGGYFVLIDQNDPDLPSAGIGGITNPATVSVGEDTTTQDFPLGSGGGGAGSGDGGTGSGDGGAGSGEGGAGSGEGGAGEGEVLGDSGTAPIETGLVGSGTGSFDGLLLLLTGSSIWLRRRYLKRS